MTLSLHHTYHRFWGVKNSQKYEQQQRRYEALEHRRQRKEQVEAASVLLQLNTGETLRNGKIFPSGRGFPDKTALKEDDKLTTIYTGLPSFGIFMSLLNFVTNKTSKNPSSKLTHFQGFLLPLMKLRLNLSNYDIGFRFCIHETTVSRILTRWLQLMDVRLSPLIRWPEREELQKTMPWCFRSHYDLRITSIIDCFEVFIEKPTSLTVIGREKN